jgi:two-component system chemotaxis response regulator CheY
MTTAFQFVKSRFSQDLTHHTDEQHEAGNLEDEMAIDVLVVDDSTAIRKILQRVLRQTDLQLGEIVEAGDGVEALELLRKKHFGLILSDINMPNMDGLQLLSAVRKEEQWKKIPLLLITTEGSQEKVLEAANLGANGYVRKPFTADQIREKLVGVI